MPGWLKALLIVVVVLVLVAVGVIGAGVYYVMRNKDTWIARGKEIAEEGKNFGRDTDNQGCVDEGVSRYKKEPGLTSIFSNTIFMQTCLDASKPTPGFCEDVPKSMEFMKSAEWKLKQCRMVGLQSDNNCQNLFTPVQQFCENRYRRSRESNSNQE
ncbi:MAG TPA: hypothetical protein VE863_14720 [Pyrinomonadaceae bacterium]|jgi:hypothetical protein|nr:hypothetical protein [Pyrinomonadaceae bacterium]